MKNEKAKILNSKIDKWIGVCFEILNATKYNKSGFVNFDLIVDEFDETDFEKLYSDLLDEINENIEEYQNIDYISDYLEGAFTLNLYNSLGYDTFIKSEIIKNGYEVKFLLSVTEIIDKYIELIENLISGGENSSHSTEFKRIFHDKMITLDSNFSFEDIDRDNEDFEFEYDRFDFDNLKQELSQLKFTKEKINLINERLIDYEQWCIRENEINKEGIWDVIDYDKSEFTKLCHSEIKRYEPKREPTSQTNFLSSITNGIFKWNSSDTDFLELFAALYQNESIVRADGKSLTRKEMQEYFQSILKLQIKDPEGKLTKATSRKLNMTPFIDSIKTAFEAYAKEKEDKLESRR